MKHGQYIMHVNYNQEKVELKGIVYIMHGLGEYSHRWASVASIFAENGFRVHCIDFPGHGLTVGSPRGHVGGFSHVLKLGDFLLSFDKNIACPKFLLGNSMGGMNAFRYVTERPYCNLHGLILAAPAFGLDNPPSWGTVFIGSLASKAIPSFVVDNRLDPEDYSRIPEEVAQYKMDPLVHRFISLQTARSMLDYQDYLASESEFSIDCPVLMCHGDADKMTSPTVSKIVYDKIKCKDKTFKSYSGGYHACTFIEFIIHTIVHYDLQKEQVIKDWLEWLSNHVK